MEQYKVVEEYPLYKNKDISARKRAEDILIRMTIQEKVGQLNQRLYGFSMYERVGNQINIKDEFKDEVEKYSGLGVLYGLYRADPWSKKDESNGLTATLATKAYNQMQEYVIEHSRLSIPMLLSTECPHGHQALGGYLLPVNLAVAATFNPKLYKNASKVCAMQLKRMGVDLALISMLDIVRDPRWGRSEECYGEDPYLASQFARAVVEAYKEEGVAVVAKHFCAQGEGTGGVNASAATIGERELREIHLPAVKAVCDAKVEGIMAAYNEIDGIPCHSNKRLIQQILRKEMKFEGVVMSDGVAIDELNAMTGDSVLSAAKALNAGVDIGLWDQAYGRLEEAYHNGLITIEQIDESVLRVLELKFKRGLFDNPYIEEKDDWTEYDYNQYDESLSIARESVILLKNDGILPIKKDKIRSIGVIGPNADEIYNQLGDYSPPIKKEDGVTVLDGIRQYIQNHKLDIELSYAKGCNLFETSEKMIREAVEVGKRSDMVILVLGGSSSRFLGGSFENNGAINSMDKIHMDCGEGVDCSDIRLTSSQRQLVKEISKVNQNIVTVVIQGRPYAIADIVEVSKGVLAAFYPGIKGGIAIADILFASVSPSGRLPVSIPRDSAQLPVYYNYKSSYQGMKYYDKEKSPLFQFGYGLSYTNFQYNDLTVKKIVDSSQYKIIISINIKNVGKYDSYVIPQLYIRHLQSSVVARVRELKDFKKLWLNQGEEVECTLTLDKNKLSVWNEDYEFVLEDGEFEWYLSEGGCDIYSGKLNR